RRHTRFSRDWSSDVCSSDLILYLLKTIISDRQFLYISCVLVGISSALAVILLKSFAHSVFKLATYLDTIYKLPFSNSIFPVIGRSEERRVGKDSRSLWWSV